MSKGPRVWGLGFRVQGLGSMYPQSIHFGPEVPK